MKWPFILIFSGIVSLVAGLVFSSLDMHDGNPDIGVGNVQWNSSAHLVAEQVAEADAIVRVKLDRAHPSRALVIPLPPGTRREELKADVIPFTDSGVRVEDVYKGSVSKGAIMTIMQTGGRLIATDQYKAQGVTLADDPLFVKGGDHILFLKSITGDSLHVPQRDLYRVVNPAGRYDVHGETVVTHTHFRPELLPSELSDLVDQIEEATAVDEG